MDRHQHTEAYSGVDLFGLSQVISDVLAYLARHDRNHASVRFFEQPYLKPRIASDVKSSCAYNCAHVKFAQMIHSRSVGFGVGYITAHVALWVSLRDDIADGAVAIEMNRDLFQVLEAAAEQQAAS